LSKTVCTLTAIQILKYQRWAVNRVLVIAPKKVAEATWSKESAKWFHLSSIRCVTVLGTEKERLNALHTNADVYVINRDNVQWLVKRCGLNWPFDCVVLDESSSFKNPRAQRFRALKAVRPKIRRMIELTGTPAPHGLTDLWAQIFLLDGGKRLGRTIGVYRDMYFLPDKRNGYQVWSYKLRTGAEDAIYQQISDICVSMKASDYLTMPDLIMDEVPVKLDAKARKQYEQMERDSLLQVSDDDWVTAGTAGVLTGKLLQLCNGAVYDEQRQVHLLHDCKIEAFLETLEQLNGQHALVFYQFQHDRDRLVEALARMNAGRVEKLHTRVYADVRDEEDWNAGKIDVLLAHPASCAYGLNLQAGGHHVIWFGLTWNLEEFQQGNKRLHRQGQECPVIVHIMAVEGGMDEIVIKSLTGKERVQEALLRALKAKWEKVKGGSRA
jgi:SNF2 family DNA or RNA helicase